MVAILKVVVEAMACKLSVDASRDKVYEMEQDSKSQHSPTEAFFNTPV